MTIDWISLIIVAVVSIGATAIFAGLLSLSIRLLSAAQVAADEGRTHAATRAGGWILLGLIGVMIIFSLYLIIPQFH